MYESSWTVHLAEPRGSLFLHTALRQKQETCMNIVEESVGIKFLIFQHWLFAIKKVSVSTTYMIGIYMVAWLAICLQCRRSQFDSWVEKILWRRDKLDNHCRILGLPWWFSWYRIRLQCGRCGFNPWVGKIPGEGNSYLLQYSGKENSMYCIAYKVGLHNFIWYHLYSSHMV